MESMNAVAFEQYIIDDEIIGASCNLLKGIVVDEEHLAFETIKQVGPGGHYLMSPHTLKHMRSEYFEGNGISDTGNRSTWERGEVKIHGNGPIKWQNQLFIMTLSQK